MATVTKTTPFLFVASSAKGRTRVGFRSASTPRALAELLRRERLLLRKSVRLPVVFSGLLSRSGAPGQALKLKDTVALNEQLHALLSRGVPLVEALEVCAQTVTGPARPVVSRLRESVAAGAGFGDACLRSGAFDRVTVAVYRAAERTGDLAGASKQLAVTARRQMQVQGKAITLLIYPAIVLSISIAVVTMMLTLIVPRIASALSSMNIKLPWFSKLVLDAGTLMRDHWLVLLAAFACLIVGLIVFRTLVVGAVVRAARRVPAVKSVILAQESTRFFSTMAAMTRSGVPLADALGVANHAVGIPLLRTQLDTLRTKLIEGGVLRNLVEQITALPIATRRLLIAAERSGDLETAFDSLAADMADETDRRSMRLLAILEPLLIVMMFAIIGTILIAIFVPMITIAGSAA
jgi:type II secretory pathway component PulF